MNATVLNATKECTVAIYTDYNDSELNKFIKNTNTFRACIYTDFTHLKECFSSLNILIILLNSKIKLSRVIKLLRRHKLSQKVYIAYNNIDEELFKKSLLAEVDEFIFKPFNYVFIKNNIENNLRKHAIRNYIVKIRSVEKKALLDIARECSFFYNKAANKYSVIYRAFVKKAITNSFCKNLLFLQNYDTSTRKTNLLRNSLLDFFEDLMLVNIEKKESIVSDFAKKMLVEFSIDRAEEIIIEPLHKNILNSAKSKKIIKPHLSSLELIDILKLSFELERRLLSLELKYNIQEQTVLKTKELRNKTLHLLMSSSSDKLNNLSNNIEAKFNVTQKLLGVISPNRIDIDSAIKISEIIKKRQDPYEELKKFLAKQSRIFLSYDSIEKNKTSYDNFEFLLDFVYVRGLHIKHSGIKSKIIRHPSLDTSIQYVIDENIILSSIYAIVENAIEAKAKNIHFFLCQLNKDLIIDIKNDGHPLTEIEKKHLFSKHYSTKKKFGLGLSIAHKWLLVNNYKLIYSDSNSSFTIVIPYKQKEQ